MNMQNIKLAGMGRIMFAGAALLILTAVAGGEDGSGIVAGATRVEHAEMIEQEIERRIAPAQAALWAAMEREDELKDFAIWDNVEALNAHLEKINELRENGAWAAAYDKAFSISTTWLTRQVTYIVEAMPFMVLGPIGTERFTDRSQFRPSPVSGALDEAWLGEFEFDDAPAAINYRTPEGSRRLHRLASELNPWEARDKLAGLDPAPELRMAWLIGGGWDFGRNATEKAADAWGVYYAWSEVHAPETRGMGMSINAGVPCLYLWQNGVMGIVQRCPDEPERDPSFALNRGGMRLSKGWNRMFVKVLMRPNDKFNLRFYHHPSPRGARNYMDDLQYRIPEK